MQDGPQWDYWPCACTMHDRHGNLKAIKQNHRSVKRCKVCRCERPEFIKASRAGLPSPPARKEA